MCDENEAPTLTRSQKTRINAAIKKLNDVMAEIKLTIPEANYYLEDAGNFNVLSGPSHEDGYRNRSRQDRIMHSLTLNCSGGGGW
jgi:hypothetical protein